MLRFSSCLLLLASSPSFGKIDRLSECLQGNGEDLDACHLNAADNLRDVMRDGDASTGIIQVDPMDIDVLNFDVNDGGIDIKAEYTENVIKGMSDFTVKSFRTNTKKKLLIIKLDTPLVTAAGKYDFDGSAAVVDLDRSTGDYTFELRDSTVVIVATLVNEDNQIVIKENPRLTIKVGSMQVNMKNLFNGKAPNFAEVIHKFINNDPDRFLKTITPPLKKKVGDAIRKYYKEAAKGVSVSLYGY